MQQEEIDAARGKLGEDEKGTEVCAKNMQVAKYWPHLPPDNKKKKEMKKMEKMEKMKADEEGKKMKKMEEMKADDEGVGNEMDGGDEGR